MAAIGIPVDEHRGTFGVEPICRVLQIAPSGYRRHAALAREPHKRCCRAQRDDALVPGIERVWKANIDALEQALYARQPERDGTLVHHSDSASQPRFNHHRLLEPIGYIPPAEAEANYYRQLAEQSAKMA